MSEMKTISMFMFSWCILTAAQEQNKFLISRMLNLQVRITMSLSSNLAPPNLPLKNAPIDTKLVILHYCPANSPVSSLAENSQHTDITSHIFFD